MATVMFEALSVEERTRLCYSLIDANHGLHVWENWTEERRLATAMDLNPVFHTHGFHADVHPTAHNSLWLRVILPVATIRETVLASRGELLSDQEVVEQFRSLFPDAEARDLDLNGLPELCMVGNWARFGFEITGRVEH